MIVFIGKLFVPILSPILIVLELLLIAILLFRSRPWIARATAIATLVFLFLAGSQWFSGLVTRLLESANVPRGPLPHAEAIVVLSSGLGPAIPPQPAIVMDDASANRLFYAAQLYHAGYAASVILSGGHMPWLKSLPPLSQTMAEVMEAMGVPKSAIIQEPDSANTYENAVDVKAILKARHIGRVLLVTSAMHMRRALALFKHQGVDAIAAPCDFASMPRRNTGGWQEAVINLIPDADSLRLTSLAFKEMLGLAVYRVVGLL